MSEIFTCEGCELDYITGPNWEDECYCRTCYLDRFPRPEWLDEQECEGCNDGVASHILQLTDSVSMDNLSYVCENCGPSIIEDWVTGWDYHDITGWEIRRI